MVFQEMVSFVQVKQNSFDLLLNEHRFEHFLDVFWLLFVKMLHMDMRLPKCLFYPSMWTLFL